MKHYCEYNMWGRTLCGLRNINSGDQVYFGLKPPDMCPECIEIFRRNPGVTHISKSIMGAWNYCGGHKRFTDRVVTYSVNLSLCNVKGMCTRCLIEWGKEHEGRKELVGRMLLEAGICPTCGYELCRCKPDNVVGVSIEDMERLKALSELGDEEAARNLKRMGVRRGLLG